MQNPDEIFHEILPGYIYLNPIVVSMITPDVIPQEGGQLVTLSGDGFTPDTWIIIGDETAMLDSYVSRNEITFLSPSGNLGAFDLVVTKPFIDPYLIEEGITRADLIPPEVTEIIPQNVSSEIPLNTSSF